MLPQRQVALPRSRDSYEQPGLSLKEGCEQMSERVLAKIAAIGLTGGYIALGVLCYLTVLFGYEFGGPEVKVPLGILVSLSVAGLIASVIKRIRL